jgi:hypothetical protein
MSVHVSTVLANRYVTVRDQTNLEIFQSTEQALKNKLLGMF